MTVPRNLTVLVLDDNPLVLKLCRALLEREGANVLTAASWIEFNHVLASSKPDVMLIDINLPSIKGNRLSEVLKSQTSHDTVPVILISDLPEPAIRELFPSSGADAWLSKPLTRDKVIEAIQKVLPKR
jgi:two-component system, chemotaxis family, response regulator PixG